METITTVIQDVIYEIRGQKVMLDRDLAGLYGVEVKKLNQATKRNIERFPPDFMFQLTQDEWDNLRSQIVVAKMVQEEGLLLRSQIATAKTAQEEQILRSQIVTSRSAQEEEDLRSQFATANKLAQEADDLRSQFVTANQHIAKVRFLPYVFTEHGVLMLSNVLKSTQAVKMSIQIIRVFDKLRRYALEQTSKDIRIEELHKLLMLHIEHTDHKFSEHDETIQQIIQVLNNLIEQPKQPNRIGFNAG